MTPSKNTLELSSRQYLIIDPSLGNARMGRVGTRVKRSPNPKHQQIVPLEVSEMFVEQESVNPLDAIVTSEGAVTLEPAVSVEVRLSS